MNAAENRRRVAFAQAAPTPKNGGKHPLGSLTGAELRHLLALYPGVGSTASR